MFIYIAMYINKIYIYIDYINCVVHCIITQAGLFITDNIYELKSTSLKKVTRLHWTVLVAVNVNPVEFIVSGGSKTTLRVAKLQKPIWIMCPARYKYA